MRLAVATGALALGTLLATGCVSFHSGPFPDEPEQADFTKVDGTRVRYVDVGEGPPVVLLHGFNATLNTWDPVIPALAQNHRVLALDLRGFGFSGRPEGADYSPKGQAELVYAFLDERGVDEVAVAAHSWGSSVALRMALARPERVRRLALYSAYVYDEQLPTFFYWARASGVGEALFRLYYRERLADKLALAFYDPSILNQEFVDEVRESLHRPGALAGALEVVRGQRYAEVEKRYGEIDQPTLLLWGREDEVTLLSVGEKLSTQLPDSELVVYPRCGHFPMIEARAASTRKLAGFFAADLEASGAAKAGAKASDGAGKKKGAAEQNGAEESENAGEGEDAGEGEGTGEGDSEDGGAGEDAEERGDADDSENTGEAETVAHRRGASP